MIGVRTVEPVHAAKSRSCQYQQRAKEAVETAYIEVTDQVVVHIPAPQARRMFLQKFRQNLADFEIGFLVRIDRVHGNVFDHGTQRIETEQHVGFKEVPLFQFVQRQFSQHAGAGSRVPIGGIHDVPVTATELGHEGQHGVSKQPDRRHALHRLGAEEPVAFGVVSLPQQERPHKLRQQGGVHLSVTVNLHHDVHAIGNRCLVCSHDSATHAPIFGVEQHAYSWVLVVLFDETATAIRTGIIYGVNDRHFGSDGLNDTEYMLRDFVAGNSDGYAHGVQFLNWWRPAPRRPLSVRRL